MTKKKPDFLRDLDTAIMDELTGGSIKGNAAGLVGTLTQIKEIKNMALCGLPVKKVWEKVREFLAKYTDELPDTDELDGDSTTGNVEEHRTQER